MSFGEKIPPFCFPDTNSGLELDVIREALAYRGHKLLPSYYPLARIPIAFKQKYVNATMTDLGEDLTPYGGHYGEPAVWYDNVFITLEERNLSIKKPADLKGLSVISFQGALKRYPDWLTPVKEMGNYHELNNQELQVLTLNKSRYDVVLSDRNIFKYFSLKLKKSGKFIPKPITEHPFIALDLNNYRPVFRDPSIRDDFNLGLKNLKDSGRYQEIYDHYLKE
jgi:polar amino acid transport system substrate-binding protein